MILVYIVILLTVGACLKLELKKHGRSKRAKNRVRYENGQFAHKVKITRLGKEINSFYL